MKNSFVIKGNICQTKNPRELDLYEGGYAVCVDGVSRGIFDVLPEEYSSLPLYDYGDKLIFPGTHIAVLGFPPITLLSTALMIYLTIHSGINYIVGAWKYLDPEK